jgi:hypothetical protein
VACSLRAAILDVNNLLLQEEECAGDEHQTERQPAGFLVVQPVQQGRSRGNTLLAFLVLGFACDLELNISK